MSKLTVTNFSNKTGSPFKNQDKEDGITHEEVFEKTNVEKNKDKCNELSQKASKKTAEYQANKPSSGVFTEVVTHGVFTSRRVDKEKSPVSGTTQVLKGNGNGSKSLLSFPSSANDLALAAKTDLESDPNISNDVKEKVIQKLFALVSMVQHVYESKVRLMSEFDKFKDTHFKTEVRREKEHSEQMYKLNMNFQNEVVQALQQMKNELDFSRNLVNNSDDTSGVTSLKDMTIAYDTNAILTCDDNSGHVEMEKEP